MKNSLKLLAGTGLVLCSAAAFAASPIELSLSASAEQQIPNDQYNASLYVQAESSQPTELAEKLNQTLNRGLQQAKNYRAVETTSEGYNSWPVYDKNGKVKGYSGRATIRLKSRDMTEAAELTSKLQGFMLLDNVSFSASTQAVQSAESSLIPEAVANMKHQAQAMAKALGRSNVTVKEVNLGQMNNNNQPRPYMMALKMAAPQEVEPTQAEWQPGKSTIQLNLNGKVILD